MRKAHSHREQAKGGWIVVRMALLAPERVVLSRSATSMNIESAESCLKVSWLVGRCLMFGGSEARGTPFFTVLEKRVGT